MIMSTIYKIVLLALAGTVLLAQTPGTSTGTLTVNGKAIKLSEAKALRVKDWDMGPNGKLVEVTVVDVFLSDVPVDDPEDDFDLGVRGKGGTLHGLRMRFDRKGKVLSAKVYDSAFGEGVDNVFPTHVAFKPGSLTGKEVGGKVTVGESDDMRGTTYSAIATFKVPIGTEPKPTVEGAVAAETAPAKAVEEFIRSVLAKDKDGLKRILRKEFVEMLENPEQSDAVMAMLGQFYPAEEAREMKIVRVFDFGEKAWVEGTTKRQGENGGQPTDVTFRIRVIRVNNDWKVQPM